MMRSSSKPDRRGRGRVEEASHVVRKLLRIPAKGVRTAVESFEVDFELITWRLAGLSLQAA